MMKFHTRSVRRLASRRRTRRLAAKRTDHTLVDTTWRGLEALEPRVLLSGVIEPLGADAAAIAAAPPQLITGLRFGSDSSDWSEDVAVDALGNAYIVGNTDGVFEGQSGQGERDVFVAKYNVTGEQEWAVQYGTSEDDRSRSVAVDGNGNLFVLGTTLGAFDGYSNLGENDAFIAHFNSSGNLLWLVQFGTDENEEAREITVDPFGAVLVTGLTRGVFPGETALGGSDLFIAKFDPYGNMLWVTQDGTTENDDASGIGTDRSGNIYIGGHTSGTLPGETSVGGRDAFVARFTSAGTNDWYRQFGSDDDDVIFDGAVDEEGNVYATGRTSGNIPGGGKTIEGSDTSDGFVARYDANGNQVYLRQSGTTGGEFYTAIGVNDRGFAFVTGFTSGSFIEAPNSTKMFLLQFDQAGNETFVDELSSEFLAEGAGVSIDAMGRIAIAGSVQGSLFAEEETFDRDAAFMRYSGYPDPQLLYVDQFGTETFDAGNAIGTDDDGNIYVAGMVDGALASTTAVRSGDGFVAKYSPQGALIWTRQIGSAGRDSKRGIAVDGNGNVYAVGYAYDAVGQQTHLGGRDAYITMYDTDGDLGWIRQFGTAGDDDAFDVIISTSGDVLVVGSTTGAFGGFTNQGGTDLFIATYDDQGNMTAINQLGTSEDDVAYAIAGHTDGSYAVAGFTRGAFPSQVAGPETQGLLIKFDDQGNQVWLEQHGTDYHDNARDVAIDTDGSVYVVGDYGADFVGGADGEGYLRRYNAAGVLQWDRTFGSDDGNDIAFGVFLDIEGDVQVAGFTGFGASDPAGFVTRYDKDGNQIAFDLVNTDGNDSIIDIHVDGADRYVVGWTDGSFPGHDNPGGGQAFLRNYERADLELRWGVQFGSGARDYASQIIRADDGSIYMLGATDGDIAADFTTGSRNYQAFVRKYNSSGEDVWTTQFGTPLSDFVYFMDMDSSGNLYVTGTTRGAFEGETNLGEQDAFVLKIDRDGDIVWVTQFGTDMLESASGIAIDAADNIFVNGNTRGDMGGHTNAGNLDAYIARLDTDGNIIWIEQFGTSENDSLTSAAIAASGGVYVGGGTEGVLDGTSNAGLRDAFIAHYDVDGNQLWIEQFGTSAYEEVAVMTSDVTGNIYLSGNTQGAFAGYSNMGSRDVFVSKFDATGTHQWTSQYGSDGTDLAGALVMDSEGDLHIAGYTGGTLPGQTPLGGLGDAFYARMSSTGDLEFIKQFGGTGTDSAGGVAIDPGVGVYLSGSIGTAFPSQVSHGLDDAYLIKLDVFGPEIDVRHNGSSIDDGENLPSVSDGTFTGGSVVGTPIEKTFVITNTGAEPLNIGAISIVGAHAADFSVVESPLSTVDPGGETQFTIRFTPGALGLRYAAVSIVNNDSDESPFNFSLRGQGLPDPDIALSFDATDINDGDGTPDAADGTHFGSVTVGEFVDHTFAISNTGAGPLTLTGTPKVAIVGAHADDFEVIVPPMNDPILPGGESQFTVRFSPGAATVRYAAIIITSDDPDENPFNIAIRGAGVAPVMSPELDLFFDGTPVADGDTTPSEAEGTHFGTIPVGSFNDREFTIANNGNAELTISNIEVRGAHLTDWSIISMPDATVAAGESTTFTVRFTPGATNTRYGAIVIDSNDGNENPYNFLIRGVGGVPFPEFDLEYEGTPVPDGDVTPSTAEGTQFGVVEVGQSVDHEFTINNTGASVLNIGAISIVGLHASDFSVVDAPAAAVASGGSTTFTVRFTPSATTQRYAAMTIASNDSDENPYNFALRGRGIAQPEIDLTFDSEAVADNDGTPTEADGTHFGVVETGSFVDHVFTIENNGSANLLLNGSSTVSVVGVHAADFTVVTPPALTTITPAGSTTFTLRFTPSAANTRYAAIVISNDDSDENPYNFAIRGIGVAPAMASAAQDELLAALALQDDDNDNSSATDNADEPSGELLAEVVTPATVDDDAFAWLSGQLAGN